MAKDIKLKGENDAHQRSWRLLKVFGEYCEDELVGLKSGSEIGYEAPINLNGHRIISNTSIRFDTPSICIEGV